ncbi:hypothetical protein NIM87_12140 [Devosia sp. XJ19-1]|uniref:Uncharacterized protein n=1 Tax=Devosia ureilytica TaxID=2952754 RepID=A0A9Q4AQI6_9HYPH|nr:hypothetical protein [Devosia ureilytica]MCP8884258.1 hypothetical protein [Devosia ureilytica]MCP8887866.1 hypothetical protein [Devosia ureilytica]
MQLIENISLSERAAVDFGRARSTFRAGLGEAFALVWVSDYREPTGETVATFTAGYMCGPVYLEGLAAPWALARLPDGAHFYFMPRFQWSAGKHYLIDKPGSLFSIASVTPRS